MAAFLFLSQQAFAVEAEDVLKEKSGPGGCDSKESCAAFCDQEDNFETCSSWAKENKVWDDDQAEKAEKFHKEVRRGPKKGPGGCESPEACRAYCENPSNQDTCFKFAEENGFITKDEANKIKELRQDFEQRKKEFDQQRRGPQKRPSIDVQIDEEKAKQILADEGGPGGCKTFEECGRFCDNPDNQKTCFEFAEKHNLVKNRGDFEKIKKIIDEGGPGGCKGEEQCHAYCEDPEHGEECIDFGVKNGFMSKEEGEKARKGFKAFKEKGGPGGCRGPQECQVYCQSPQNQEACFNFAKENGFIEESELKKFEEVKNLRNALEQSGGPGGCRGESECRSFCDNPDNQEVCLNFAADHGGFDKEEAQKHIQEFKKHRQEFENRRHEFENKPQENNENYRREFPGQGKEEFPGRGEFPGEGQYPGRGREDYKEHLIACPQDAKVCPDGKNYVGRVPPNCEFAQCPSTGEQNFRYQEQPPTNNYEPLPPSDTQYRSEPPPTEYKTPPPTEYTPPPSEYQAPPPTQEYTPPSGESPSTFERTRGFLGSTLKGFFR